MNYVRSVSWLFVGLWLSLTSSAALAQQGGGGMGGGGFGGGGGGGGGFGGGNSGFGAGNNVSLQSLTQSPQSLPSIIKRSVQGTFGTRQLGSGQRQRYRGFLGSSQAGMGQSQYGASGAFSQARRGALQGTGLSTFGSFTNAGGQRGMQATGQMGQNQFAQNRPASGNAGGRRVTVRVGFQPNGPAPREIAGSLQRTLNRVQNMSGSASVAGRTVVLSGVAASSHDRQLAETLALMEPGVDRVQNNIVAPSAVMPNVGAPSAGTPNVGVEVGSGNIPPQALENVPPPPRP
ncbi:MAG TPA: BON domain-containing protein [Pirellulales bacterium]|nr:BON domain-containing protein [Pirellulales bacterium]